jgi:tetratricopeptide (TPR) repeat protein
MNYSVFHIILSLFLFGICIQAIFADETADEWYEQGNTHFNKSEYEEALQAYDKAFQLNQNFTAALISKGITYQKLCQGEIALDTLTNVVETHPEDADGWFALGSLYFERGNYTEAADAFRQAIVIRPAFRDAWNYLGNALFVKGLFTDSAEAYQKTLEIDPQYENARDGVNMTHEAAQNPAKGWKYIGDYLYGEGKFTEALHAYNQSLFIDPAYVAAQTNLNTTISALLDPEKAMLGPPIFSLMFGDYDSALKGYEKVICLYPDSSDAWSGMGLVLQKIKHYTAAEHAYQEALRLKPDDDKIWKNFGDLLLIMGKENDARNAYEQAQSLQSGKHRSQGNP